MVTNRVQTSRFPVILGKLIRKVLLEIEEHDLQRFMERTSLRPHHCD
jgi:hypothetical protein